MGRRPVGGRTPRRSGFMEIPTRTFIAFALPGRVIRLAADLQARMKCRRVTMRWVRPENIHLTLKFLGDIRREQMDGVVSAMQAAARGVRPFDLDVQGMGVFPSIKRPRVLWMGLGGQIERLHDLHARLDDHLASAGHQRERRPYRGHLTLARIKAGVDPGRLLDVIEQEGGFSAEPFQAVELVLFKSDLRPQGAVYTSLSQVALENKENG
ncbi:MAG: RNA 2',3'-cyclic phosphodiesterase [Desulfatitalea sp.]|nr:RNA 2',3'-cyclic phosphodiesterase [Desulfatitalea sp.]NNK00862.1 RNA 2',3'-cyclic phosphodiesterase [Desulfatitalea sp.]